MPLAPGVAVETPGYRDLSLLLPVKHRLWMLDTDFAADPYTLFQAYLFLIALILAFLSWLFVAVKLTSKFTLIDLSSTVTLKLPHN